jgi:K+-sensing histidine kinase KdpD
MKRLIKIERFRNNLSLPVPTSSIWHYFLAALSVIISSGLCFFIIDYIGYQSVSFILLFVVSILSIFLGIGPITLASTLSAFIWNFFFIPPKFTIDIDKTEDALMFGMFFIIALVNGILTSRIRRQERMTRDRESRTNALYHLTKELSFSGNLNNLIKTAKDNIKTNFGLEVVFILQDGGNNVSEYTFDRLGKQLTSEELIIAGRVFDNSLKAGKYTEKPYPGEYTFYPLTGNRVKPGVMAVKHSRSSFGKEDEFWDTFLTQISNAVERELLNDLARKARFLDESDKLYKTLFNSISHELRIPLASIMSASESMLSANYSEEIQKELSHEIIKASSRLNRLIDNLLNMSRLESGHISPRLDWYDIYDLINKVTDSLQEELKSFKIDIEITNDMPFVRIDFGLIEQVLYNLIYNATQYAATSTDLHIIASFGEGMLTIEVLDNGPGFPEKDLPLIFDKFFRVEGSKPGGTGLGLSIAKGFTEAHKGTLTAENRQNGGAKFTIRIPSESPDVEISV